jgi:hypothetical protein
MDVFGLLHFAGKRACGLSFEYRSVAMHGTKHRVDAENVSILGQGL